MSTSSEFLCLRWNEFEANIKSVFAGLRSDEEFFDVTLACGTKHVKAHKVILCAFSPTLRSIIKAVSHAHPLLYLRGINFAHLESLISFMYNGEVNVAQEDLDDFLSVAEELQIKGLVQGSACASSKKNPMKSSKALAVPPSSESLLEKAPSSSPPKDNSMIVSLDPDDLGEEPFAQEEHKQDDEGDEEDFDEYGTELHEMSLEESSADPDMASGSHNTPNRHKNLLDVRIMKFASSNRNYKGNFKCLKCSYETPRLMDLKRHIESKHFVTDGFPCETCGFRSKTRYGLYRHRTRNHRLDPEYFSTI